MSHPAHTHNHTHNSHALSSSNVPLSGLAHNSLPIWHVLVLVVAIFMLGIVLARIPADMVARMLQPHPSSTNQPQLESTQPSSLLSDEEIKELAQDLRDRNQSKDPTNTADEEQPERNELGHIKDPELEKLLNKYAGKHEDTLYLYAADLDSETYGEHRSDITIPSGSIYKMFVAEVVFKRAADGRLNMNSPSGVSGWTIGQCTQQMVQNSSNACGEALRAKLRPKSINKALREQGYTGTDLAKNPAAETSARDVAMLFNRIYQGDYFTQAHNDKLHYYLKNQLYRFRIPEGLPRKPAIEGRLGTRNKTGDVYGYTNDAAIVLGENTDYILVILSGEWPSPSASSLVHRRISGELYNYFNDTDYDLPY